MKQFIESLKRTSYYNKFFERGEVIAIYILGSRSIGIIDEQSDYDIVVITTDGEIEDPSNIEYLKY
jgi:predicted nucleotidyltransferase